jgi:hypothetical protein
MIVFKTILMLRPGTVLNYELRQHGTNNEKPVTFRTLRSYAKLFFVLIQPAKDLDHMAPR